ncbi:MAG: YfhO family protein, partial [Gemmatimonadaceae bacterium]|nr:YfhO family protein [Gemmatimonadaceae bacterium]
VHNEPNQTSNAALPAPRFAFAWASAVYALCTLSLAYPALSGKFLVSTHSDQYIAGYAFRDFAARTLRDTGHFPLWNPYLFGGLPYVAAMHGDIFYPTFLLRMIMPTDAAMTWGFAIHLFLAGIFAFGFFRIIGYGFYASLIGGIAYMMGGQLASLVSPGHDGKLFVSALFPLALWMLYAGFRQGKKWAWGVFALTIGLAVLSPHPQLLQYMLLTCGAYSLYLAFSQVDGNKLARDTSLRRLGAAFATVLIGAAIGAIQYLPVRAYVPWSPRAGGLPSYDVATSYAWPVEELLNTYLPQFSGMLDAYWGQNRIHLHSEYIGAVVLMLMGAAFIKLRRDRSKGHLYFWICALVIALLWALGGHTPFYHIPYALVPGTKFFRAPATIFFVGAFAISLLACAGVEKILARQVAQKYFVGWAAVAAAIALLASVGGLTGIAQSIGNDAQYDRILANSSHVIAGAWRSFVFVALTSALAIVFLRGRIDAKKFAVGLAAIAAIDLWTIMRLYWIFSAPASQLFATDMLINAIKKQPQPTRVLSLALAKPRDPFLGGDALMVHDVRQVLGYHGNQLGRYNTFLGADEEYKQLVNPNAWKLLNIQYVLADVPDLGFIANIERIAGPERNAAGTDEYLFRLPGESPYAWVAPVMMKAPDALTLPTVLDSRFDVTRVALFDTSSKVQAVSDVKELPPALPIRATVTHYEAGRADLELSAPAPQGSALLVSENYYPGWKATVDGKPAKTDRADYTLVGVELPAGAKKISLTFDSPEYHTGKAITLAAIVAALVILTVGALAERRTVA